MHLGCDNVTAVRYQHLSRPDSAVRAATANVSGSGGVNGGAIAGIVIGALAALLLGAVAVGEAFWPCCIMP